MGLRAPIVVCPPRHRASLGQSLEAFSVLGPGSPNHADHCLHLTGFSTSDPKEHDRERDRPIATTLRSGFVFCSCAVHSLTWLHPKYCCWVISVNKDTPPCHKVWHLSLGQNIHFALVLADSASSREHTYRRKQVLYPQVTKTSLYLSACPSSSWSCEMVRKQSL